MYLYFDNKKIYAVCALSLMLMLCRRLGFYPMTGPVALMMVSRMRESPPPTHLPYTL